MEKKIEQIFNNSELVNMANQYFDEESVDKMVKELKSDISSAIYSDNIDFNYLMGIDIKVCEVLEAERVPKTDKLLKLLITTGSEERVSITNIGEFIEPEELIGKKIPFILNLPPMKMRGIETTAMIFISSDSNGINIPNIDNSVENGASYLK
jgi:methionyl-tRNA synthetase